ncbi:MAG: agmatinase [Sedimentisphaerales bacterium]
MSNKATLDKQDSIMNPDNSRPSAKKYPYNFGAIAKAYSGPDAAVCLIPFGYDSTSNPTAATRRGPEAILRASRNLELFDSEVGVETYKVGLATLDEVEPNVNSPLENSKVVEVVVTEVLNSGKLPIILGGDHSLTLGAVRAALAKYPDIGVLILDAHPDVFDKYEGTEYGHASVTRRIHELGVTVIIAGLRSASRQEFDFIRNCAITTVPARDILKSNEAVERAVSVLPERIYLSLDLDVMDPGEMPAVANPEPGGLRWYDIVDCLERVTRKKTVVGFDVVELCPIAGNPTPDFIAAKLIYRTIGLIFRQNPA